MTGTLTDLEIDGIDRRDNGELDFFAEFTTDDDIHVAVYALENHDTHAYWVRTFDGSLSNGELVINGNISKKVEPDLGNVTEMVKDHVVLARIEQGMTVEEASDGIEMGA